MPVANPVPSLRIYTHTYVRTHSGALRGASAGEGGEGKGRTRRERNKEVFRVVLSPPSSRLSVRWQQRGIVLDNGLRKEERREGGATQRKRSVFLHPASAIYTHHIRSRQKSIRLCCLSLGRHGHNFFLSINSVVYGKVRWELFSLSWLH